MEKTVKGFTLYELLITMAIVVIITSIGIPNFSSLIKSSRSDNLYHNIFTLIQYTRSKAAFFASDVILCPTENKKSCHKNWSYPLMIFIDKNGNKERDQQETIDKMVTLLRKDEKVIWKAFGSTRYIRFVSDGSTEYQSGNLTICPANNDVKYIQKIILYKSGRARKANNQEIKPEVCR